MSYPAPHATNRSIVPPLAFAGERIGLMGGTFNPPHEGHLACAETALRRLQLNRLWWMVTPGNPLKQNDGLPTLEQRIAASRSLTRNDPRIVVTGFEQGLSARYTFSTLRYLKQHMPGVRFVWIMGADNLVGFNRWQNWRGIANLVPIAIVDRPGWRHAALASPAARALARFRLPESRAALLPMADPPSWAFLTTRLSELSSTSLRTPSDDATP
ncbi:nicotinate-nucleotide adenylyltransferase [Hyphomicrobium sulfonivorans]|uniref:nicotinate-nucleotide adenylyltransferase n=1 Tax=Hyphomicrobium sulfonivorans TaxID=121290 RepID=UPI00156D8C35|nr:nicotinate-nucleotide adenylyltransferase [Hyphomicrobium sulfonivorans]MBI1648799.1 nicotinate-nucleotide adenylyltransferase [Hyphomicrobium sulfonivorans]NSL70666.1 nicotinic acid mononucleotide adenylyltransferase [Hyphomicrobium sulfonivorans]